MNVCLVTGAVSEKSFASDVPKTLLRMGLRVVVLFVRPQPSAQWSRGGVVYCSAGLPWQKRVTPVLETLLESRNIAKGEFPARLVLGVSRRLEGVAGCGWNRVPGARVSSSLPRGVSEYAVFHALDQAAESVTRELATEGHAKFLDASPIDVAARYEQLQMDWLVHPCAG